MNFLYWINQSYNKNNPNENFTERIESDLEKSCFTKRRTITSNRKLDFSIYRERLSKIRIEWGNTLDLA